MAKRKEITASFYIGDQKVDKLPPEYCEAYSRMLSATMSRYYTHHKDEYRRLCDADVGVPAGVSRQEAMQGGIHGGDV